MHDRTCQFKTTGKRKADLPAEECTKKRKDGPSCIGGALEGTLVDYRVNITEEEQSDIFELLKDAVLQLRSKISVELGKKNAIKFYVSLYADFHIGSDTTFKTDPPAVLNTPASAVYESGNIDEMLDNTYDSLVKSIEDFHLTRSGWVLEKLLKLDLHILELNPLSATSHITLPK